MRCRIALLRMNERREENWITDEENGRVVSHKIPIAYIIIISILSILERQNAPSSV